MANPIQSIHDDDEAPIRHPEPDQPADFFDLDFNSVSNDERAETLEGIARRIDFWLKPQKDHEEPPRDALVLVMPEGYGKSHLVLDLIARKFKVVFCAKSHSQLDEKQYTFRDVHNLTTTRYVTKLRNLRSNLATLGIPDVDRFRLVEFKSENPYAPLAVDEPRSIEELSKLFDLHNVPYNPAEFFAEHYVDFKLDSMKGNTADVTLLTFTALQSLTTGKDPWWKRLGLIAGTRPGDEEEGRKPYDYPFEKVAIVFDDPDQSDVDWLRPINEATVEKLEEKNEAAVARRRKKASPMRKIHSDILEKFGLQPQVQPAQLKHTIIKYKNGFYLQRPIESAMGYRLKLGKFSPKLIVTTTEWITGYFALQTLKNVGLRVANHLELFRTSDCKVTALCTTITRKAHHAVLLPIVEKLREEFPDEDVALIASGLGCELNLSNNKGRNDLMQKTTIIKLSWPHPSVTATIGAHFADTDVENFDHDLLIATQLADLGNQAIGRNQGFRFQDRQAIILIDPKYHKVIMNRGLLRYSLTPWSSKLPDFNKKTTKRAALAALHFSAEQSPLEQRLLALIHDFESFGISPDAQRLAAQLPEQQRAHYDKWLAEHGSPEALAVKAAEDADRRAKNAEKVRRHRSARKAPNV